MMRRIDPRRCFYAEYMTDRYVRKTFFPDYDYKGCMIEVGCATPELLSMSQHFRQAGWRCIGVEPNPAFVKLQRQAGNEVYEYAASDHNADDQDFVIVESSGEYSDYDLSAHSFSSLAIKPQYERYEDGSVSCLQQRHISVKVRTLDTILQEHCPEVRRIDLLAVDVEGYELEVMKGFRCLAYGTKVVVLENLFHDAAYTEYMESIGYRLHSKIHYNYIYCTA